MANQIQLADGGYLETYGGSDGRLHVQKYTAGGTPVGPDHALPYESPQFAALSDGGFVVTRSFYAYGLNTEVYVFSPASEQLAMFGTAGAKLLASPEGGFALAGARTEYRGDGDGPETVVALYSNAGVKVFEEGPFLGESSGLTLLASGDYQYAGVTIDPSNPRDALSPSTPQLTIIDDVEPQGSTVNDPSPTLRVAVTEEGRLQYSGSPYHSDPYSSRTVTAEDVARGYVDIQVNGGDGTHSYRLRMIDNEGLVSSYTSISYTVDTTAPGAPVVVRVMDNQRPVEGQVPAGGTTDDISPTLHLSAPGAKVSDAIQLFMDGQPFGGPVALTVADVDRGYVAITPNVAPGSHSFSAQVTDTAGNTGPMGGSFSFTVQSQQQPTTLSITGPVAKAEGNSGATAFTFNVTRSGDLSQSTAVDYFLLGDPADFTGQTTGTLTFQPGEQSKTIEVLVQGDTTVEADETFEVGLANARGGAIGTQKAQGVIQNDDGGQQPTDSTPRIAPGESTAGGAQFSEQYLPTGTTPDASKLSYSGKVTIASPDGYKSIVVGGHEVVKDGAFAASSYTTAAGQKFAFTAFNAATGELSYTYTLQAATTQQQSGGGTPTSSDRPMIVVTDNDGDVAQNLFIFAVQDDRPVYGTDHTSIPAGASSPLTGNLLANDKAGADGWGSFNVLHASSTASAADAQGYKTLQGTYGVLRFNSEGDYSYTVNASAGAGSVDRFSYGAPDADGSRHPGPSGMPFEITITAGSTGSSGQAIRADQPGDTLAGGSGADTLYASQGPDQLTGGGGADHFAFEALPWRAGVVTDFADGSDRIDLRALYQASGYTGTNAVADGYVRFDSDGSGGTRVMYDTDGAGTAQAWAYHITTLQGVAPSSLSNADLVVGPAQPPPADAQPSISPNGLSVDEAALANGPARDMDVITLTAADGVDDFKVEGRAVIVDGVFTPVSFTTALGATLSFTAYDAATTTLSVSYSLESAIDHTGGETVAPNLRQKVDRLTLELTDRDGDVARSLLNASVNDDRPIAQNDSDIVTVGGSAATGNVITDAAAGDAGDADTGADRTGADTPLRVTAVRNGPVEDTTVDANGNFVSTGRFGTLSIKVDGSYSYVLNTNPENGVTDSFGYTVTDADGSTSGASLSIQVQGGQTAQGQVIRADQAGDTLAGGSGADTLYASQGPDQLTGGGGGDHFAFEALPWRAGVVTDFADRSDRIDLRALYQASGYTGSDAVADRYVSFESDGAGGTKVMYDTDGAGTAQAWSFHIVTLQGVAPAVLSNADLVGGSAGGGGSETQPGAGQVLTASKPGDTLVGGAGNDTLNASQGPDQLTGAGGADRFMFAKPPWSAGVITDFAAGADKIDVSALLEAYAGSNPIADGWMRLEAANGSTKVYVDIDGAGGEWPFLITTLQGVAPGGVSLSDFVL